MNGIINILKPPGMTSSNVVGVIRRLLNIKRVGHSGTLDPAAAGVLPIFFGKATRLTEYSLNADKEYIGEITFGASTDTQDAEGKVVNSCAKAINLQTAQELFSQLVGNLEQIPPAYSAVKVDGKKLYEYARKNQKVKVKPRIVHIYESNVLEQSGQNKFLFKIRCSKGTYIRTICHDIGEQSGAYAHLSFLLRTQTGSFSINDALRFEQLQKAIKQERLEKCFLPMDYDLSSLPKVVLIKAAEKAVVNGGQILFKHIKENHAKINETASLYIGQDFYGICQNTEQGIKIKKMLR